jgi:hypothetical protein
MLIFGVFGEWGVGSRVETQCIASLLRKRCFWAKFAVF